MEIHVCITKLANDGLGLEPSTVSDVVLQLNYDELDLISYSYLNMN